MRRFFNPFRLSEQRFLGSADQISRLLGGYGEANPEGWHHCRCPVHDDQRASLALKDTPRGLAVKCFAGCRPDAVKQAIEALLKSGATLLAPVTLGRLQVPEIDLLQIAARIWHESVPIAGTLAECYLRGRAIDLPLPDTLRFHPAAYHKESGTFAPAMIALVQNVRGEPCAIHRTWLDAGTAGKANLAPVRKSLCSTNGHAVHLIEADRNVLYVGEGLESALSFAQLRTMKDTSPVPVWAASSASGIASLNVPDRFTEVVVIGDRDQACVDAANKLARRLPRRIVSIQFPSAEPPHRSKDFNDMLMLVTRP
jgi:hypothetical protein